MGRLRIDRIAGRRVVLLADGIPVFARCWVADRPLARLVGLLGTSDLADDEALLIPRCNAVHTIGMRDAVDVAFAAPDGRVLDLRRLVPGRFARCPGAAAVIEARRWPDERPVGTRVMPADEAA